jgi:hypothetical protein
MKNAEPKRQRERESQSVSRIEKKTVCVTVPPGGRVIDAVVPYYVDGWVHLEYEVAGTDAAGHAVLIVEMARSKETRLLVDIIKSFVEITVQASKKASSFADPSPRRTGGLDTDGVDDGK